MPAGCTRGRSLEDGRGTRVYNLGFVVFTLGSLLCSVVWSKGSAGATELIVFRLVQAIGGSALMANSAAILTDAFPVHERGLALGLNQASFILGTFLGIVVGVYREKGQTEGEGQQAVPT